MPRLSPDGQHALCSVQGVFVDGVNVVGTLQAGLVTQGWGWLSPTEIVGYGGWNTPATGLYHYDLSTQRLSYLQDGYVRDVISFWAGDQAWLGHYANGARDSAGRSWPSGSADARAALGMSRQNDELFVTMPDYATLVVRAADGTEQRYGTGAVLDICMDRGVILYAAGGRPTCIGAPTPPLPNFMRFCTQADGSRVLAGYASGFGLCVAKWDAAPLGYVLSGDGRDFNPDVQVRASDGRIIVASGANQGETELRLYEVDLPGFRFRRNGGGWAPLTQVNLLQPGDVATAVHVDPLPPMLVGTFYAFSDRYGDTPEPIGNCCIQVTDDNWPTPGSNSAEAAKRCTVPAIAAAPCLRYLPDARGVYVAGSSLDELARNVVLTNERRDLPRLAYLDIGADDSRGWGSLPSRPTWLRTTDLLGIQCYCPVDANPEDWGRRMLAALERIRAIVGPDQRIAVIVQTYDRNGQARPSQVVQLQPLWWAFVTRINACGLFGFADRRTGGLSTYASLRTWFRAYAAAVPRLPDWATPVTPVTPGPTPSPVPVPPAPPAPTPMPFPHEGEQDMKYLSYQMQDGKVVATPSDVIDAHSKFQQTGTCFALAGITIGYNVMVFGAPTPGGLVNFQKQPMFTPGWDTASPSETGRILPQADGTVAIQWPL